MASYEETLTNITLDADTSIAVDTSQPYTGNDDPAGGSAASGFQYRFLQVTDDRTVGLYTSAVGEIVVGVLQNKPQVEGAAATVAVAGVSLVEAGAAVAAGVAVTSDTTGRVIAGTDPAVGIALRAAGAAGDLIPVLLRIDASAAAA